MIYKLRITALRDRHAKTVVARQLSRELSVPFQTAFAMTGRLPLTLSGSGDAEEVALRIRQFAKVGIEAQAVEAQSEPATHDGPPAIDPARQQSRTAVPAAPPPISSVNVPVKPAEPTAAAGEPGALGSDAGRKTRVTAKVGALIAAIGIVVIAVVALMFIPHSAGRIISDSGGPASERGAATASRPSAANSSVSDHSSASVDPAQPTETTAIDRSQGYADSAKARPDDADGVIRFYKLAVAFNERNLHAWYGLLSAFQAAGKNVDAQETEARIGELFGKNAGSIERLVEPLGALADFRMLDGGTASLRYRTSGNGDRDRLTGEAFTLVRALRTVCDCKSVTVVIETGGARGLSVECPANRPFGSMEEFKAAARIRFVGE